MYLNASTVVGADGSPIVLTATAPAGFTPLDRVSSFPLGATSPRPPRGTPTTTTRSHGYRLGARPAGPTTSLKAPRPSPRALPARAGPRLPTLVITVQSHFTTSGCCVWPWRTQTSPMLISCCAERQRGVDVHTRTVDIAWWFEYYCTASHAAPRARSRALTLTAGHPSSSVALQSPCRAWLGLKHL